MKTLQSKRTKAERDGILTDAIKRALHAMMLLQGTRVTFGRKSGFVNFENEIFKLVHALQVLGLDPASPAFQQFVHETVRANASGAGLAQTKPC